MAKKTEIADVHGFESRPTVMAKSAKTVLGYPGQGEDKADAPGQAAASLPPVVGWMVVIDGPGKGRSREITFGLNSIGRDDSNAITLDFGDTEISGSNHFRIAYDGLNRVFLISAGDGRNLVYVNRKPVLDATELLSGTDIRVGATTLRFVALCGPDWSWDPVAK